MAHFDETKCPLCGLPAKWDNQFTRSLVVRIPCKQCGEYFVAKPELSYADDAVKAPKNWRDQISALLYERYTVQPDNVRPPLLLFSPDKALPELEYATSIRVADLLSDWPRSVSDHINRALLLMACIAPRAGDELTPEGSESVLPSPYLLAENRRQAAFLQNHLMKLDWLEHPLEVPGARRLRITPKGWAQIDQVRRQSARTNPAFVAMLFGRPDKIAEMTSLYENAILQGIRAAGYTAHRSDRDEHNDGIMDKIRFDINRAPFVVADLTSHNLGVYYEVGLASGQGIEVIHCCPESCFDQKHFDIAHRNLIKYNCEDDLRTRLERRILGSKIGPGPHFGKGQQGAPLLT